MSFMRTGSNPAGLKASPKWLRQLVADLDRHEGFRQYAYPDPLSKIGRNYSAKKYGWGMKPAPPILAQLGLNEADGRPWTFGHGFTKGVTSASSISKEASTRRLEQEALSHAAELDSLLPEWRVAFPLYAQTVFANMIYNLGRERLSKFTTTLNLAKHMKFAEAGRNLRASLWFKQVGTRAQELVKRLETGKIAPEHQV